MANTRSQIPATNSGDEGRAWWILPLGIVLLGLLQRCLFPQRAEVEHFDEGVYASNVAFADEPGRYPMQHLYAPPLSPALIEWSILLFGTAAPAAMLPNLLAGTLTVLAVWWVGRNWFGPAAGVCAAALCAFSDFHVLYTRTALTDPLLCFWMLAAVYCIGEGHRRLNLRWSIVGGVFTGLAWWTKYNGWVPLAVQISGVAAWLLFHREHRRDAGRHIAGVVVAAGVAALVWLPVWRGLQPHGGYAAVAQNHRGYFVGLAGWMESLQRQIEAHRHFDGYLSVAGVAFAALCAAVMMVRSERNASPGVNSQRPANWLPALFGGVALLCGLAAALSTTVVIGGLAVAGIAWRIQQNRESSAGGPSSREAGAESRRDDSLPTWLLAAWFVGLLISTPLYRAYPRLTLPWLVAGWLGAGAFAQTGGVWLRRFAAGSISSTQRRVFSVASLVGGVVLLLVFRERISPDRFPAWQDRSGMRIAAKTVEREIADSLAETTPFVVYVYAEPGMFYQLVARQRTADAEFVVAPAASVDLSPARAGDRRLPTFLVTGPHASRSEAFRTEWESVGRRFQLVAAVPYAASDLVLLNEYRVAEIAPPDKRPQLQLHLWRLRNAR